MTSDPEYKQDPELPPGWFAWSTALSIVTGALDWHARPPGRPDPKTYVDGPDKATVAAKAWEAHKRASGAAS
jgi:hypothetical protein